MQRPAPRFRLRLFAQEFDLHAGTTRIGRSPLCEVTIDDPAISREHAVIEVGEEGAVLRDLGSRNGLRVNGKKVVGDVWLAANDRIRVGNQDLVFGHNASYARETRANADVAETCEIDARLTPLESASRTAWWLEMQTGLLHDALRGGLIDDARGIVRRMEVGMRERLESNEPYDRSVLETALAAVLELARAEDEPRWVELVFDALRDFRAVPGPDLASKIESLPPALVDLRASRRRVLVTTELSQVS